MRENERRFHALLYSLRKQIYIPEEVDHHYLEYLAGIFVAYEVVYRKLLVQQMKGMVELETGRITGVVPPEGGKYMIPVSADRIVESMMERKLLSGITLSDRIWDLKNYSKDIEFIINNGIRNNLPVTTIARQLDNYTLPGRHLSPTPFGRKISFDSMRLARTEVLEARRTAVAEQAKRTPWIKGVLWELSPAHKDLCECDDYDGHVFLPDEVPMAPHPQCQCTLSPVPMSAVEWAEYLGLAGATVAILPEEEELG